MDEKIIETTEEIPEIIANETADVVKSSRKIGQKCLIAAGAIVVCGVAYKYGIKPLIEKHKAKKQLFITNEFKNEKPTDETVTESDIENEESAD